MVSEEVISDRLVKRRSRHMRERAIELLLQIAALVSVATTVGIVVILVKESLVFFSRSEERRVG